MRFNKQPNRAIGYSTSSSSSPPPLMAHSISSLYLSQTFPFSSSSSISNPRLTRGCNLPPRLHAFGFFRNSSKINNNLTTPPSQDKSKNLSSSSSSEKKSFSVATGEIFLGIASRLIKSSSSKSVYDNNSESTNTIPVFDRPRKRINESEVVNSEKIDKERIGVVLEDEIEPEVIWEQRVKDVEAEKERIVVTSPGFSFSAAGLLFPYHLGVAQFLIEKGYIKVQNISSLIVQWLSLNSVNFALFLITLLFSLMGCSLVGNSYKRTFFRLKNLCFLVV